MPIGSHHQRLAISARRHLAVAGLLTLLLAGTAVAQPAPPGLAPLRNPSARDAIPGQYIVVFKPDSSRSAILTAQERVRGLGGTIGFTYSSAILGFSAKLPPKALDAVRAAPGVDYVEVDQKVRMETVQTNPPDGLDRTSERLLPLDHRYSFSETGANVNVYVIDSGIRASHSEFSSLTFGNSVDLVTVPPAVPDTNDCGNGHGTFVAGIVGGANTGIAKQVVLHAVRVFDCTGTSSNAVIIAAADWVRINAILPAMSAMPPKPTIPRWRRFLTSSESIDRASCGHSSMCDCPRSTELTSDT